MSKKATTKADETPKNKYFVPSTGEVVVATDLTKVPNAPASSQESGDGE